MTYVEPGYYVLTKTHKVVKATRSRWTKFFNEPTNRRVAETTVGDKWVSTVFLGLDHNYSRIGLPVVFETMVFDRSGSQSHDYDEELCFRYHTWDEAVAGHEATVYRLQNELETP